MANRFKNSVIVLTFGLCALKYAEAKRVDHPPLLPSAAVSIPIILVHGLPIIQLTVNRSKDELFLVDTGAEKTLLNTNEAARMKIGQMTGSGMTVLGSGDDIAQPAMVARSVKIKFKREVLIKGDFPAISLSALGNVLGIRLSGVIGYDLLRAHPTVIDFTHKRLMIYQSKVFIAVRSTLQQTYSVDKDGLYPVISAVVGVDGRGCGVARVLLDTGNDRTALINAHFASEHRLMELPGWEKAEVRGFNGDSGILHGLTGWVDIGSKVIQIPDVSVTLASKGAAESDPYDVYLGASVLDRGLVILDVGEGYVAFGDSSDVTQP